MLIGTPVKTIYICVTEGSQDRISFECMSKHIHRVENLYRQDTSARLPPHRSLSGYKIGIAYQALLQT